MVLAGTYEEISLIDRKCTTIDGETQHTHGRIRGSCRLPDGTWKDRSVLSSAYPIALGLAWGRAIAKACFRICACTAEAWAVRELEQAQEDPEANQRKFLSVKYADTDSNFAF